MRLAICLSGQPRAYQVAFDSLSQFYFPKYECDVFIHTWKDVNYLSQFSDKVIQNTDDLHGDYMKLFRPKKIMIEDQIVFDDKGITDPIWGCKLNSVLSMFYSVQLSNKLKQKFEREKGFKYDFVMRLRTDLRINRPILPEDIRPGHIGLFNWTQHSEYNEKGFSDVFAVGPSELMDVYANAFDSLHHYLYTDQEWNLGDSRLRNEYLLRRHLDINKIPVDRFYHLDAQDPSFGVVR